MSYSDFTPHDEHDQEPVFPAPAGQVDDSPPLSAELIVVQARARRMSAIATLVVAVVVAGAVSIMSVLTVRSSNQVDSLSDTITNLTSQARLLRQQLDDRDSVDQTLALCERKLAAGVRDTTRDYNAAEGDLIIAIGHAALPSPTAPAAGELTTSQAIDALAVQLARYRTATVLSSTWNTLTVDEQKAMPCPV